MILTISFFSTTCVHAKTEFIKCTHARLLCLDLYTGKVEVVTTGLSKLIYKNSLSIETSEIVTSISSRSDSLIFVKVTDVTSTIKRIIFKGWLSAAMPSLNVIEHPRYNIWLDSVFSPSEFTEDKPAI